MILDTEVIENILLRPVMKKSLVEIELFNGYYLVDYGALNKKWKIKVERSRG